MKSGSERKREKEKGMRLWVVMKMLDEVNMFDLM
jgi:hypothetical protein